MKKFVPILIIWMIGLSFISIAQENDAQYIIGSSENIAMNPVFSPDGKYFAFTNAGYVGLYVYDFADKSITLLSEEVAAGYGFRWSADSKSILSRVARYENNRRYNSLKIFDIRNGSWVRISDESVSMPFLPEWNAENDKILLPHRDGIEIFESGKEPLVLENNSPVTVYSLYDRIIVRNTKSSEENIIVPFEGEQYLNVILSPDRTKIVFEVYGGNLFAMNTDGSGLTDLGTGYNPHWFSDSENIVYMITEDDGHKYTASDIYRININGTEKINLTNTSEIIELNPSISPDGKRLLYESWNDGAIYLMNLN